MVCHLNFVGFMNWGETDDYMNVILLRMKRLSLVLHSITLSQECEVGIQPKASQREQRIQKKPMQIKEELHTQRQ